MLLVDSRKKESEKFAAGSDMAFPAGDRIQIFRLKKWISHETN